ncbi:MAG: amidohydrolase [Synergistaceae bacterium]|jgi:aminobenzoyl-glutamate utilization protein B|nr:amidohydrolase [Synergistaceae bacterium]
MNDTRQIEAIVDAEREMLVDLSHRIWKFAELPYKEKESSALLAEKLRVHGFEVTFGCAGIPTAFVARWSSPVSGGMTAGFLGEFDALDGLSQEAGRASKASESAGAPGHGCGHNALGAGSLGAAIALKKYLTVNNMPGAVIYYGCAGEEGAGSKQFMARDGLFDGTDFVYSWHPANRNGVDSHSTSAIMGGNFIFAGVAAHAGGTPWLGRSALDAAELMSVGTNYLREHMIEKARIHYAYSDVGGVSPNVVQDRAVVKYEVRSPKIDQVEELFERVVNVAKGAALMTGTESRHEVTFAFSDYAPNDALARVADECMREIGAPKWDESDYALARAFLSTYGHETMKSIRERVAERWGESWADEVLARPLDSEIQSYDPEGRYIVESGSTDVGDVTYAVPTAGLRVATACVGNVGHSWQMTAQAGSSIADKGLITAAKMLALAAVRTMARPDVVAEAKRIVGVRNGGKGYVCPLPDDVKPPVGRY